LRELRDTICSKKDLPIYIVAGSATLDEMARYIPQTLTELRKISGFGDAKIKQYGQQFLDLIIEYSSANHLSSLIHEKAPKREKKESGEKKQKIDTKAESFRLYKEGKMFEEIAKERKLTIQTIEGHLSHYVKSGDIKIRELINEEKIFLIEPIVKKNSEKNITQIKDLLGNKVSFGEIKLVLAWLEFQKNSSPHIDH
jgi:ATP-dependent DNA helicase RecQ